MRKPNANESRTPVAVYHHSTYNAKKFFSQISDSESSKVITKNSFIIYNFAVYYF